MEDELGFQGGEMGAFQKEIAFFVKSFSGWKCEAQV